MKSSKSLFVCLIIFACGFQVYAQQYQEEPIKVDTFRVRKALQVIALPVIFYTPETQFGLGAATQLFFNKERSLYNQRVSNLFVSAVYTTEKQLLIDVKPIFYLRGGDYYVEGLFKYKRFPNSFWGIGKDAPNDAREFYNMRTVIFQGALLKTLPPDMSFGFRYAYERHTMLEIDPEGQLATGEIEGSDGAVFSGLSAIFQLDDRDNEFSPRSGNYIRFTGGFSSKVIGATHSFNRVEFDFRKFFSLTDKGVLAVQGYFQSNFGTVPFQNKAWYGGGERARGYFLGRFIDDHMYVIQAEYRWRFHPRWIAAGFLVHGEVAETPTEFLQDSKFAFGGGIRFQLLKSNQTLLRLDFGVGRDGQNGFYFGVNEAF
jgi:outer membrane protein assembly factor BamA